MQTKKYSIWSKDSIYEIKDVFRAIKYSFQRIKKGYCDKDVWNIDVWFRSVMVPMLTEFRKIHDAHPVSMTEEQWDKTLGQMIRLLKELDDEECSMKNPIRYSSETKQQWLENERNITNYQKKCKEKFFKLFCQHFWDLWD